jgi:hypothetical protein
MFGCGWVGVERNEQWATTNIPLLIKLYLNTLVNAYMNKLQKNILNEYLNLLVHRTGILGYCGSLEEWRERGMTCLIAP